MEDGIDESNELSK